MNLKLFTENNAKRTDSLGKLCQSVLTDNLIDWKGNQIDQMRRISQFKRKFGQSVLDDFFNEFREAQYAR